MSRLRALCAGLLLAAAPAAVWAQTPTPTPTVSVTPTPTPTSAPNTIPTGQNWTTDGNVSVNASRIRHTDDGSTWFMTPSTDRISRLKDGVMTEWPIRATPNIGASPVDFQLDGDDMWFIENGESLIDAGKSIIARLNTTTGALREWVLPLSRPAGFYRTPDDKIWVAQSAGVLELLDLNPLDPENPSVLDYRAAPTVTYASGLVLGPDGALWMTDFGNNRIVRHDLGDDSEKAWTILDPSLFLLSPSDLRFDDDGFLWITELAGTRVDRFDIATGELRSYLGFVSPVHLDIYGGKIYITEETGTVAAGAHGRIAILDPGVAPFTIATLTATPLTVGTLVRPNPTIRNTVITPITFTPTNAAFGASDLTVSSGTPGILVVEYNKVNAYGLAVEGGAVWVGADGFLIRLVPQTIGGPTDQTAPVALQFGASPADAVRIDLLLFNRGNASISGDALYQYSPGAFPREKPFTVGPGQTLLLEDAFLGAPSTGTLLLGPVRFQVTSGQASDLLVSVRSAAVLNPGTFGISLPAQTAGETLQAGMTRSLFTGTRSGDISSFGYFSPTGAVATIQLFAPDGTLRATRALAIESNVALSHSPAASFFGEAPEPGDVIRVLVTSGSLQPYVNIQDPVTRDPAVSLPVAASTDAVIPNVANVPAGGAFWTSGLQISNPDATRASSVLATYYPIGGASTAVGITLDPGESVAFEDVLSDLFQTAPGQGAIVLTSDVPVAASQRASLQSLADGSRYSCQSAALDGASPVPAGGGVAVAFASAERHTNLLLFNRGSAGTVTITAFDDAGTTTGQLLLPMGDHAAGRVNRVLEAAGPAGTAPGRIRVEASPGMQLYAQTVDIDGVTGDTDLVNLR